MIEIQMVPFAAEGSTMFIGWRASSNYYEQLTNIIFAQNNPVLLPWQGFYIGSTQDVALGYALNAINEDSGNGQAYLNAIYINPNCFNSMQEIICSGPELTDILSSGEEKAQALANALADQYGITVNPSNLIHNLALQNIVYTGPADDGESGNETIIPYSIMTPDSVSALTYSVINYRRYEEVSRNITPFYHNHTVNTVPPSYGDNCILPPI